MSKRAEEAQASALLPESIISYTKEHTVLAGLVYREGVKFGYEQAEKDLALMKEDVRTIFNLVRELQVKYSSTEGCLQEVADIFNEQRKK